MSRRFFFADSVSDVAETRPPAATQTGGKTLVANYPRGTYFLVTDATGTVSLYRMNDPSVDLGHTWTGGNSGRAAAPSEGQRLGRAAAADAAASVARIAEINRRNAEFFNRK